MSDPEHPTSKNVRTSLLDSGWAGNEDASLPRFSLDEPSAPQVTRNDEATSVLAATDDEFTESVPNIVAPTVPERRPPPPPPPAAAPFPPERHAAHEAVKVRPQPVKFVDSEDSLFRSHDLPPPDRRHDEEAFRSKYAKPESHAGLRPSLASSTSDFRSSSQRESAQARPPPAPSKTKTDRPPPPSQRPPPKRPPPPSQRPPKLEDEDSLVALAKSATATAPPLARGALSIGQERPMDAAAFAPLAASTGAAPPPPPPPPPPPAATSSAAPAAAPPPPSSRTAPPPPSSRVGSTPPPPSATPAAPAASRGPTEAAPLSLRSLIPPASDVRSVPTWAWAAAGAGALFVFAMVVTLVVNTARGGGPEPSVSGASAEPVESAPAIMTATPATAVASPEPGADVKEPALAGVAPPADEDAALASARAGDPDALALLEKKAPSDRSVAEALAIASGKVARERATLRSLGSKLESDAALASDAEVRSRLRKAADDRDLAPLALEIMTKVGETGVDMLYDVWVGTRGRTPTTGLAESLVYAKTVRPSASRALAVVLDLRAAETCESTAKLVPVAAEVGDRRAVFQLAKLLNKFGCGAQKNEDCYPCLRDAESKKGITDALKQVRGRAPPKF